MSITTSYRPFRSQSRVEFIKKKFETSFLEDKHTESLKVTDANASSKADFLQELRDLNLDKKFIIRSETGFEANDVNKNESKASVKRSPAFRRVKLGGSKSSTEMPSPNSDAHVKLGNQSLNENAQKEDLKTEVCDVNTWTDFKRSKTDTNLLKYCSNKNTDKGILPENSNNSKISNSLGKDYKCDTDEKILAQYAVVDKKKSTTDKSNAVNLRFTDSIRRALQSPLPKGPPPKKPPRTFATQTSATKTDIPKLKSKLEKLEKVVKIHETGTPVNKMRNNFDKEAIKTSMKTESCSMPDVTDPYQSCLPISSCFSQNSKVSNIKKLSKARSEFYLGMVNSKDSSSCGKKKDCSAGSCNEAPIKISSSEAIYDLPCINKKENSFGTFKKPSNSIKESLNTEKAEGLHYMCTDVINQTPKHPTFPSNIEWRKSADSETRQRFLETRSNFLGCADKQKASTMNRIDGGAKELANALIPGTEEEKRKLNCAASEDGSEESDLDSFTSSSETKKKKTTDKEILSETTARRKIYVSRVSSHLMNQVPCWKYKDENNYKHLFECCLLVGLTLCESKQNVPYIKSVFPPDTKPPPLIESLCFPDASYWPPTSENHRRDEQSYSLVVTNENGERKFGYCRRVLPEGGHVCLPLTYCIITPHKAGGFFYKVLEELESRHGSPGVENFIKQLYESEFPRPGQRLKLKEILEEATRTSPLDSDLYLSCTLVRRPPDSRLEEKDLTQLFQCLQLPIILKVFSSLLHERKVLLLSNSLRNLSSCIEAFQSILLPFSWRHTYIPVLPVHLIELCEAPTPYVIGLLKPRNVEKTLANINFEDGIVVDLDDSKILKCCGDEGSILPSRVTRDLKTSLSLAMNATDLLSESVQSVIISDAFIRFFVQLCGNYPKFIENTASGEKFFQKDEFIKSAPSNTMQSFLDWFTETAMFNSFIQERLHGDDEDALVKLFRRRAMEYSQEGAKDSAVLLKNYKVINKKVRTLGDKIKDFTSLNKKT